MINKNVSRQGERGNVLFLILIAVALFAALSYAVTQSTRSGGGSTEREQSILSGASMTQHPTALRTSIIRMILGGVDVAELLFDSPADFGTLPTDEQGVFHPDGGGAVYQLAPADLMDGSTQGSWFYNGLWQISQIGRDGAGGNEIIAFLPGVTQGVCRQITEEFAFDLTNCNTTITGIVDLDTALTDTNIRLDQVVGGVAFPAGAAQESLQGLDGGGTCAAFTAQPSGCFNDTTNSEFVFYSVLLER